MQRRCQNHTYCYLCHNIYTPLCLLSFHPGYIYNRFDKEYFFAVSDNNGAQVYVYEANFGNGCFGSTQLTGTTYNGADGNGIFKYDPNNITLDSTTKSFKSLSTKGLNA